MARAAATSAVERGRLSYDRRAWVDAHEQLTSADEEDPLGPDDLERMATAAYMLGRDDEYMSVLERAHRLHVENGDLLRAARAARSGSASSWRCGARSAGRRVEQPRAAARRSRRPGQRRAGLSGAGRRLRAGDGVRLEAALATTRESAEIAEHHGDADLLALALIDQGQYLMRLGRVDGGLRFLDEAMVAVTTGELSPIVTGIVYCSVIDGCSEASELRRAQEWTAALTRWCAEQPDMVSFTGRCLVHRAEVMQLHGSWEDAIEEERRAAGRAGMAARALPRPTTGQGEPEAPGPARRGRGGLPQREHKRPRAPARLALLRLAQGNEEQPRQRCAEPWERAPSRPRAQPFYPRSSRSRWQPAISTRPSARAPSSMRSPPATRRAHSPPRQLTRAERRLARGDAQAALTALRQAERTGTAEAPNEGARGGHSSDEPPRAQDADTAALELERQRDTSRSWEPSQTSHAGANRGPSGTASRTASSRCCGWSRRGRATARSPQRSSSASTRSPATCRTSSGSWASRRAPRRGRSHSSTVSCDAPAWSILTTRRGSQVGGSGRCGAQVGSYRGWRQFPIRRIMSTTRA